MAEPFFGEIRIVAFNFPPRGWAFCDGQQLPINQNQALFSLLETTFGGNGVTTFALPDLRGRVPLHTSDAYPRGRAGGVERYRLTPAHMPAHTHTQRQATDATTGNPNATASPTDALLAGGPSLLYGPPTNLVALAPDTVSAVGGNQPHENRQPLLVLSFCIALQGLYPTQN